MVDHFAGGSFWWWIILVVDHFGGGSFWWWIILVVDHFGGGASTDQSGSPFHLSPNRQTEKTKKIEP